MLSTYRKLSRSKKILVIAAGVFLVAQLAQPDRSDIASDPSHDLIASTHPSPEVEGMLRTACYDCHSSHTTYPWYSYVTPVNFWLQHHVDEGREEANLSEWTTLPERKRAHFVDEAEELIGEGEMPLPSYTWIHGDADLNTDQRKLLGDFFQGLPEAAIEWRRERRKQEREAD
ncbi:MAG TPA: heme-binding domain-containing protein [Flavobacteriales bacterium]|nr:heme-binding domain-containing protein [Flavobacteriales bacterium]